ncbi:unnamed protein product [Periconia digitata]|uniref:Uncharacterized protein n=1 Tax=Periconia digitata TaxID=1303443 RepID=A0A9W4U6F2_9PLEO|nr:unnamed protein product [Periconia digitata]
MFATRRNVAIRNGLFRSEIPTSVLRYVISRERNVDATVNILLLSLFNVLSFCSLQLD